jgi:hypothetical protein
MLKIITSINTKYKKGSNLIRSIIINQSASLIQNFYMNRMRKPTWIFIPFI